MEEKKEMNPKSLGYMASNVVLRHLRDVAGLGTVRHNRPVIKRILARITSPVHLREIEENSPNLYGNLSRYWTAMIRKDFPTESREEDYQPEESTGWYEVYQRYKDEKDEKVQAAQDKLRSQFGILAKKAEKNTTSILGKRELPREPRTGRGFIGARKGPPRIQDRSTLSFAAGTRTKNPMQKVLRQAKEQQLKTRSLGTPTGFMAPRRNQITHAPMGMVESVRVENQRALPSTNKRKLEDSDIDDDSDPLFDEPAPKKAKTVTPVRKSGLLPGKPGAQSFIKKPVAAPKATPRPSSSLHANGSMRSQTSPSPRPTPTSTRDAGNTSPTNPLTPPQDTRRIQSAAGGGRPKGSSIFMKRKPATRPTGA